MTIRVRHALLAAAAFAVLAAGCSARNPTGTAGADRSSTTLHARAAQRIVLPGAEPEAAASAANAATTRRALPESPEIIRLPDGTVGVKVAAQYFDTVIACRQPDGRFGTDCAHAQRQRP